MAAIHVGHASCATKPLTSVTFAQALAEELKINVIMYPNQRFDPTCDLIPAGITGSLANVLVVHPDSGVNTSAQPRLPCRGAKRRP